MSEKIVWEENGKKYIVNEYGEKCDTSFGQGVINDAIDVLPFSMKVSSAATSLVANMVQKAAGKVLDNEEMTELENKQGNSKISSINKSAPSVMGDVISAKARETQALLAIGKHFTRKITSGIKGNKGNEES